MQVVLPSRFALGAIESSTGCDIAFKSALVNENGNYKLVFTLDDTSKEIESVVAHWSLNPGQLRAFNAPC